MVVTLPRLYPILDRAALDAGGVSVEWFAEELAAAGVALLQYRDKTGSPQAILRNAAAIGSCFRPGECVLILNDRADLALLAGWSGVHVGHADLPPEAARRVLGAGKIVGVSTHTDVQVLAAQASTADYVAIGPVFATGSKANAEPVVGLEGVRRARALTTKPLVAIGGITRANAREVMEAGADSVAVIGALLAAGERPAAIAREFLQILQ